MSPRTAKYVEAIIREGDAFDCKKWLQKVREEEAEAKQILAASASGEPAPIQIKSPISTSTVLNTSSPSAVIKAAPVPRPIWRLHRKTISNGPTWWLKKVSAAWDDFQASRARDAVYEYLNAVFAIVEHYRTRRRTNNRSDEKPTSSGLFALGSPCASAENATHVAIADMQMIRRNPIDTSISRQMNELRFVLHPLVSACPIWPCGWGKA